MGRKTRKNKFKKIVIASFFIVMTLTACNVINRRTDTYQAKNVINNFKRIENLVFNKKINDTNISEAASFKKEKVKLVDYDYLENEDEVLEFKSVACYNQVSCEDENIIARLVETGVDKEKSWIEEFEFEILVTDDNEEEMYDLDFLKVDSDKPEWEGHESTITSLAGLNTGRLSIVDSYWKNSDEGKLAVYVIRNEKNGIVAKYEYEAERVIDENQDAFFTKVKKDVKLLNDYRKLNDEVYGLIRIDGSKLNHPLMRSSDDGFYLWHDLNREYNSHGVPFIKSYDDIEGSGGNSVIYGHRLDDNDVFGSLCQYEDIEYYKEHPYIETVTDKGNCKWLIFAYYLVCNEDENAFNYDEDCEFNSKKEFKAYMENVEARNWFEVPIDRGIEDTYLTLSSCSKEKSGNKTNRMVIMAVRVEYDADYSEEINRSRMKDNPLLPEKLKK